MNRFLTFLFLLAALLLAFALYRSTPEAIRAGKNSLLGRVRSISAKTTNSATNADPEYSRDAREKEVTGTFETPAPIPAAGKKSARVKSDVEIVLGTIKPNALRLPRPPVRTRVVNAQIIRLKNRLARFPTSADYRRLAELSTRLDLFPEAAQAYRAEAAIYRRKGLKDAALIVENKAARYKTQLQLYHERPATAAETKTQFTGACLEPQSGRYVGAFIDRDERLKEIVRGTNFQIHRRPQEFARLTGKSHSTYFTYVAYGQPVPRAWLELCKREGVIPHIAWEPKSLQQVRNDRYLQSWAAALRDYDWPVFIRFAGEMNGFWTPYHGNPKLYRAKFRLVHQMLRRAAPRVATIWCVNSVPSETIANYYPGDDGCDWVGINLYSVPFYDNNRHRPALLDNPLTLLEPIYRRYAARKPIAICEYAASHQAAVDNVRRNGFAVEKMALLYGALPRLFPRVKMINWFNQNNLKYARAGRQLNNYSLTEQSAILQKYRSVVQGPDFLQQIPIEFLPDGARKKANPKSAPVARLPQSYFPLRPGQRLPARARLSIWVKTYVARSRVFLAGNGKLLHATQGAGAHSFVLKNPRGVEYSGEQQTRTAPEKSSSKVLLTAYLYDDKNRFIEKQQIPVAFSAGED